MRSELTAAAAAAMLAASPAMAALPASPIMVRTCFGETRPLDVPRDLPPAPEKTVCHAGATVRASKARGT